MAMTTAALYKEKNIKSSRKIPSIPQEIIFDVFSWLPVKSLMRFKCISKFFSSLISKSEFMDIHLCHSRTRTKLLAHERGVFEGRDFFYTIEQNQDGKASLLHIEDFLCRVIWYMSEYLECANGVFCFWKDARQPVYICNPSTREIKPLPYIDNPFESFYSLGFEPIEKIYKVLFTRIVRSQISSRNWVFTLDGNKSWKEIESVPEFYRAERVCINGVIYMLNGKEHKQNMVAFDLKAESFRIISLWKALHRYKHFYDLIDVKGKLAVFENTIINGEVNMWILEKGQHERWERHIIIDFPVVPEEVKYPIKFFWSQTYDEGIIFIAKVKGEKFSYFFYDVTRKSWKGCEIQGLYQRGRMFGAIYSWVESLFPLKKVSNAHRRV
ncbi:putative F-box protein At1g32420 [Lycium barbarum]|uniref:putative F-box protein At1g32420 n=1 Tax=Lycium barbarum TaxID=112863 RepID=UPI00293E0D71|nr:putative F-box protein At1g32420 [Lycium barbarum]